MKHPSTRELFDYWNARRGRRVAPERSEIEPEAIRRALADTFILSFEPQRGHPFRIAGTRVCGLFRRELKGSAFLDLWSPASRDHMRELTTIVVDELTGVVASARATSAAGDALQLELLLLPLNHHDQNDARLLGALAPAMADTVDDAMNDPWLGTYALRDLAIGTHRFVGPTVAAIKSAPRPQPLRQLGRLRYGFVVYDGGQA